MENNHDVRDGKMRKKNCIGQSRRVAPSVVTINCPAVRITQRKHSISRAWILITHKHTKQVLREEWSGLVVATRKGRRRNHEERSQSVSAATPAARERTEMRNARSERFFWGPRRGNRERGYGGGREGDGGYDDMDGGLKGNEREMMQAWVRIVAKAGGWSLPTNRGKKGTKE